MKLPKATLQKLAPQDNVGYFLAPLREDCDTARVVTGCVGYPACRLADGQSIGGLGEPETTGRDVVQGGQGGHPAPPQ